MPKVLTTASTVTCGHTPPPPPAGQPPPPPTVPGLVRPSSSQKLKVKGKPVLVRSSLQGATVQNCPLKPPVGPPCQTVVTVVTGESLKLRARGQPVLLDRITLTTAPALAPLPLTPDAGHSTLFVSG